MRILFSVVVQIVDKQFKWKMIQMNRMGKIITAKKVPENNPLLRAIIQLEKITYKELRNFSEKLIILIPTILAAYLAGIKISKIEVTYFYFIPVFFLITSQIMILLFFYPKKGIITSVYAKEIEEGIKKGLQLYRRLAFFAFLFYIIGIVTASILLLCSKVQI